MSDKNTQPLDPFTGLPIEEKASAKQPSFVNPFTGEEEVGSYQGPLPTRSIPVGNYQDPINKYQRYNVPLRRQFDWNEERARRQTTGEKWKNGLLKAGTTMVGAVAENTVGVLAGIYTAANQGDLTGLYDNPVGRAIDRMNETMREDYPNYYTRAEQEAEGLASLGYANFWADKAANGAGYALASVATLIGTGGAGLITRGLSLGTKGLRMYKAANMISKGMSKTQAARQAISSTAALGKATTLAQATEIGAMMAYGESSVEAREILNSTTQRLMQERADELGIQPDQLSQADLMEIRDTAAHVANVGWGLNMATLSATNLITFNKILFPKYLNVRGKAKGITYDTKLGKYVDRFKTDPTWKTTLQRYGSIPALGAVTETFQEGTQFAIQQAASDIADKGTGYNDVLASWTEALVDGYGETFNSKEGKESMMLGFIIGGLMGGGQAFGSRLQKGSEDKQRAQLMQALNDPNFLRTIDRANATEEQMKLAQEMDQALQAGDHKTYRDKQFSLIQSTIAMYQKAGALDLFEAKLNDAKSMSDEDFRQMIGAPEGAKIDKNEIVEGIKKKVREYEETVRQVDNAMPTRPKQGIDRLFMNKDAVIEEQNRLRDEEQLKAMMVRKAMNLEDSDSRIDGLVNEVNTARAEVAGLTQDQEDAGGLTREEFRVKGTEGTTTEELVQLPGAQLRTLSVTRENEQLSQETLDKLERIEKEITEANPAKGAEVAEKIADLKRLANDRGLLVNATKELFGSPEQRSAYFQREKQKEYEKQQQEQQARLREEMGQTRTARQLTDLIEGVDISMLTPEFAQELYEELEKRNQAEETLLEGYRRLTLEQLKEKYEQEAGKEEPDPVVMEVLENYIKEREKDQQEQPEVDPAEPTQGEITEQEKQMTAEEQAAEDEVQAAIQDQQTNERQSQGNVDVTSDKAETFTVVTANGEFQFERGRGVVFEDGKPVEGNLGASNGVSRQLGRRKELEGTKVIFRRKENDPYNAIEIVLDGTPIGIVAATRGGQPRPEFAKLEALVDAKGEVEGVVKTRLFLGRNGGNILTEKTAEGTPVMKSVMEALRDRSNDMLGYAVRTRNGLKFAFDRKGLSPEVNAAVNDLIARTDSRSTQEGVRGMTPGQVGMVTVLPNGEVTILPISSTSIGAPGMAKVLDELAKNDIGLLDRIQDIAGIRRTYGDPVKFTIDVVDGKYLINIALANGEAASFEGTEFVKFMRQGNGRYRLGSFQQTQNKKGETETKFVARRATPAEFDAAVDGIRAAATSALSETKRQFDIELMLTDSDTYVSPYTGKEYGSYTEYVNTEVLQTDIRLVPGEGLPFFDTQISFEVQGMTAQEAVDTIGMPAEDQNVPDSIEVEEKATDSEPGTKYDEDDIFGEPQQEDNVDPETGQKFTDDEYDVFRLGRQASKKINRDKA